MRRRRTATPWIWGVLTVSLLFAILYIFSSYQYIGSDDAPILRAFMGYEGGEPATFHLYLHTAFAWLLWALAKLFPGAAWFSILQLFLLWYAQVVIVKSLVQLAQRHGFPAWAGALAGAGFLAAFTLYLSCRITYTTTSALCGAAAVAQLMSVDFTADKRRSVTGPIMGSALLLLCAYCLRQISVLPPLCFWLVALGVKLLSAYGAGKRPWRLARPVFAGVLATAVLFGAFAAVREADIRLNHAEDFIKWQDARIQLFDYTDYGDTTTDDTLASVGWSRDEFSMVTYWYFLDDNITTDAFKTLYAQQTADDTDLTLGDRLQSAQDTVTASLKANPVVRYGLFAALAMAAAALLMVVFAPGQKRWPVLGVVGATAGGWLLLAYLGYTGRLPMRAAVSVLLPMAAYLYCAFFTAPPLADAPADAAQPQKPPRPGRLRRNGLAAVALAVCLWMTVSAVLAIAPSLKPLTDEEENYGTMNLTDLDAYALDNPDMLFIYDLSLVSDHRLFPDTSAGIPDNVMFWGGYPARSPSWYRMLARFGITELSPSLFLRDDVVLASTDAEPYQSFAAYLADSVGETVDWNFYDIYGYLFFMQFFAV